MLQVALGICFPDAQQRVPTAGILHSPMGWVAHLRLISWSQDGLMDPIIVSLKIDLNADRQYQSGHNAGE